ncbi:UNVERIFIED_ORG: hypothetical protein FHU00_5025 [Citrobacter freundii]
MPPESRQYPQKYRRHHRIKGLRGRKITDAPPGRHLLLFTQNRQQSPGELFVSDSEAGSGLEVTGLRATLGFGIKLQAVRGHEICIKISNAVA